MMSVGAYMFISIGTTFFFFFVILFYVAQDDVHWRSLRHKVDDDFLLVPIAIPFFTMA